MTTQYTMQRRWPLALIAATVLAGLTIAGCGPAGSSAGDDKAKKPLKLGDPSPETVESGNYDTNGNFTITPKKVVEGKAEDLRELGDDSAYADKKLAWIYVNAKLVDGDATVKSPMLMTNMGALAGAGGEATRLQVIGGLSSRPKDCVGQDLDVMWKQGDNHTWCEPYLIPASSHVTQVTYSQDYYKWSVK